MMINGLTKKWAKDLKIYPSKKKSRCQINP
jgi:hypothetical protein